MSPFIPSTIVLLVLAACGPRAATTTPTPPPAPDAAPAVADAAITRLRFDAWPGSNTHRWGTRYLELRGDGDETRIRLHDEIDFQGSGMQPHQMPPTRHSCSRWEPVPEGIELPASVRSATDCSGAAKHACDEVREWLGVSRPDAGEAC